MWHFIRLYVQSLGFNQVKSYFYYDYVFVQVNDKRIFNRVFFLLLDFLDE